MSSLLFTGSSDGALRAFRIGAAGDRLEPAGSWTGDGLSFFSAIPWEAAGEARVFVSGKGSLRALAFDSRAESLRLVAQVPTVGSGTHLTAVHRSDGAVSVFLAHYHEHKVSHFSYDERSGFGEETVILPGEHPHQTRVFEGSLFIPCLGSNWVAVHRFPGASSPVEAAPRQRVSVPGGPRHLVTHPRERVAFLICELNSRIECLDLEPQGTVSWRHEWSTATHPDGGAHWSSDLALTPAADRILALNRDPSELCTLAWSPGRAPVLTGRLPLSAPIRSFSMDPHEKMLHLGGEDGILHAVSIEGAPRLITQREGLGPLRQTQILEL